MQSKKLTPLEILHKQKNDLQVKSDELSRAIGNHSKYLQENLVPLLRDNLVESAVSKMPFHLRNLTGNFIQKRKKTNTGNLSIFKVVHSIALGIAEIAPFFLKGKKGAIFSFIVKPIIKWLSR